MRILAFILCLSVGTTGESFSADIGKDVHVLREVQDEDEKIEYLIKTIENLRGAAFIRNRSIYTPKEAARHLRSRLKSAGQQVNTAEDFIEKCATRSSATGQKYTMRFSDGRIVDVDQYLRQILSNYDS